MWKKQPYFKIINYVKQVAINNSAIASLYNAGLSHEKRNLSVLVLKASDNKRRVWIGEKQSYIWFM